MQITGKILMVRPACFGFNEETAKDNFFQREPDIKQEQLQQKALKEFDAMVETLTLNEIEVIIIEDTKEPPKPDAIFPNNWFCTNENGVVSVFPMFAQSRRAEKRDDILQGLAKHYNVVDVQDWSEYEAEGLYLEGTGSMVCDHENKIIYACVSSRTSQSVLARFALTHGYKAFPFTAHDINGKIVYHTNVLMCIGEGFALFCPKAITDHDERVAVAQLLETTGHQNIYITLDQMHAFAGNMLHVKNRKGERFIVLSQTAFQSLEKEQIQELSKYGKMLPIDVSIIEEVEGGSVRCMMAEIFLEPIAQPAILHK